VKGSERFFRSGHFFISAKQLNINITENPARFLALFAGGISLPAIGGILAAGMSGEEKKPSERTKKRPVRMEKIQHE
jgi:hypothetical protein